MGNRRISPLIILPPLIFLGLAFLFILGVKRENPNDLPSVFIDQPAPNITESPLNGFDPVLPSEITRPNIKLVNFWASWCPPCRAELPKLLELSEQGMIHLVKRQLTGELQPRQKLSYLTVKELLFSVLQGH